MSIPVDSDYDNDEDDMCGVDIMQQLYDIIDQLPTILQTKLVACLNAKFRCVFEGHRAYIMFHEETPDELIQFMYVHVNYEDPLSNKQKKEITAFVKTLKHTKKDNVNSQDNVSFWTASETSDAHVDTRSDDEDTQSAKVCVQTLPSMHDYTVIQSDSLLSENCFVSIRNIKECIDKCKSNKAIQKLESQIETHFAYIRTDQYGDKFDKCGTMVRSTAGVRHTSEGHCSCNEQKYKSVIHSGCIKCCVFFPLDTRICKCSSNGKAFHGSDELEGHFPQHGCMHPGDWNTNDISFSKDMFSLCLVCGTFDNCEHGPIHKDAWQITKNYYHTSTDQEELKDILSDIMLTDDDLYELEQSTSLRQHSKRLREE
jgi:hypothetical protein